MIAELHGGYGARRAFGRIHQRSEAGVLFRDGGSCGRLWGGKEDWRRRMLSWFAYPIGAAAACLGDIYNPFLASVRIPMLFFLIDIGLCNGLHMPRLGLGKKFRSIVQIAVIATLSALL